MAHQQPEMSSVKAAALMRAPSASFYSATCAHRIVGAEKRGIIMSLGEISSCKCAAAPRMVVSLAHARENAARHHSAFGWPKLPKIGNSPAVASATLRRRIVARAEPAWPGGIAFRAGFIRRAYRRRPSRALSSMASMSPDGRWPDLIVEEMASLARTSRRARRALPAGIDVVDTLLASKISPSSN